MPDSVVSVVFRIINFMLVLGAALYVFRKYFAATITEKIHGKEQQITGLQEQSVALRREQSVIDERISQDKKYAEILDKKIEQWQNYIEEQRQQEAQEEEVRVSAMKKKHEAQEKRMQQQWVRQQVLPEAIKKAEEQLKEKYADPKEQEQFVSAVIQTIENR